MHQQERGRSGRLVFSRLVLLFFPAKERTVFALHASQTDYALTALHNFMNVHGADSFEEAIELERTGELSLIVRLEEIDDRVWRIDGWRLPK